jgi:hypothetical protein
MEPIFSILLPTTTLFQSPERYLRQWEVRSVDGNIPRFDFGGDTESAAKVASIKRSCRP